MVDTVRLLHLPRYGLANYLKPTPDLPPTPSEAEIMRNLSRAGKRLIGFCRTNLFKRLESSGHSFLLSVRRHILRNFIFLHALANGLALPIGTQDSALFETRTSDATTTPKPPAGFSRTITKRPTPLRVHRLKILTNLPKKPPMAINS